MWLVRRGRESRDGGGGGYAEVEEHVREEDNGDSEELLGQGERGVDGWEHEDFASNLEGDEEDLKGSSQWMTLVEN